jgi:hypothetical protein
MNVFDIGDLTVALIAWMSGALVSKGAPGWVAILLLLGLIAELRRLSAVIREQVEALDFLRQRLVEEAGDTPVAELSAGIDADLGEAKVRKRRPCGDRHGVE